MSNKLSTFAFITRLKYKLFKLVIENSNQLKMVTCPSLFHSFIFHVLISEYRWSIAICERRFNHSASIHILWFNREQSKREKWSVIPFWRSRRRPHLCGHTNREGRGGSFGLSLLWLLSLSTFPFVFAVVFSFSLFSFLFPFSFSFSLFLLLLRR